MTKELKIFENDVFGNLTVINFDNKILFVGKEVATMLGYSDTDKAIRTHCKYLKLFRPADMAGLKLPFEINPRGMTFINEKDLYRLIMKSELPSAEKFQDWVCDEVLPAIRKTGSYSMMPQTYAEALRQLANEVEMKELAEKQRDEAVRTKAWIGSKREATSMALASAKTRENECLKKQIGDSKTFKQVKAISWLGEYFDLKNKASYSQIGRQLTKLSEQLGYEPMSIEDSQWGSVKAYHIEVIKHLRFKLNEDLNMMRKYRKAA